MGKIGGMKFWRMSKKGCFGEYDFGDLIHVIDHTHSLPAAPVHDRPRLTRCYEPSHTVVDVN